MACGGHATWKLFALTSFITWAQRQDLLAAGPARRRI
jgi:hypothetical protein